MIINMEKTDELKGNNNETSDLLTEFKKEQEVPLHELNDATKKEQSPLTTVEKKSPKKVVRNPRLRSKDSLIIFQMPFFELLPIADLNRNSLISARCLSCNDSIRGVKNVNSNFIRHLKRVHPSVYKEYEAIKATKLKSRKMKEPEINSVASEGNPKSNNELPIVMETTKVTKTPMRYYRARRCQLLDDSPIKLETEEMQMKNIQKCLKIEEMTIKFDLNRIIENQEAKITQMEKDLRIMEKRCHEVQGTVENWRINRRYMQREIEEIDQKQRERNIIISNFKLNDDKMNLTQSIEKFISEELLLPDIKLANVILLAVHDNKMTVKLELKNADANVILIAANRMRNNVDVIVQADMSSFAIKRRNKLLILSKEILRRNEALHVTVSGTKLIINDVHYFYWDDVDGLRDDADSADAVEKLNSIAGGSDYNDFIGFLKHFDVQIP